MQKRVMHYHLENVCNQFVLKMFQLSRRWSWEGSFRRFGDGLLNLMSWVTIRRPYKIRMIIMQIIMQLKGEISGNIRWEEEQKKRGPKAIFSGLLLLDSPGQSWYSQSILEVSTNFSFSISFSLLCEEFFIPRQQDSGILVGQQTASKKIPISISKILQ